MIKGPTKSSRAIPGRTLVMFSGGIDSTAALWHVLNHPERYRNVHVHHIHMQNIEARWKAEALAVKAILRYFSTHTTTPFTVSESAFNTPHLGGNFLFDTEVISFMTGFMTSRDPKITKVIIGATGTDFARGVSSAVKRGKAIHNAFHEGDQDHSGAIKEYPLSKLTKEEVYKTLPPDLAVLTWSCRTPRYADGKPIECGRCKTCKLELSAIERQKSPGRRNITTGDWAQLSMGDQQGWWDYLASKTHGKYGNSFVLDKGEMDFQRRQLKAGGDTLVLGATYALCALAKGPSKSTTVTSVDFSQKAIEIARIDGVRYVHSEWNDFFEKDAGVYDNIMCDGGPLTVEYPDAWEQLAKNIHDHLRPGGIFASKFYIHKTKQLKKYKNPSLGRFILLPTSKKKHWRVTPTIDEYKRFHISYTVPPKETILKTFKDAGLTLIEEFTPKYEAGDRFLSFAWRRD